MTAVTAVIPYYDWLTMPPTLQDVGVTAHKVYGCFLQLNSRIYLYQF